MRARGQATLILSDGEPVVAKAGLKFPGADKFDHNERLIEAFLNRTHTSSFVFKTLRPLRDIHLKGGDLSEVTCHRRYNLDYDFKREPCEAGTRLVRGEPLLFFTTRPWCSVGDFMRKRTAFEQFRANGRVLKTLADYEAFQEFCSVPRTAGINRAGRIASVAMAKRMFLRAYARLSWGIKDRAWSSTELAAWLSDNGYPTNKWDVENAARKSAKLVEHAVPHSAAITQFLAVVQKRFPGFDCKLMLEPVQSVAACDFPLPKYPPQKKR